MGYYIETPVSTGKADWLIQNISNLEIAQPTIEMFRNLQENQALVCVVENGIFDAVGFCFSESELEAFTLPDDTRHKRWLILPRDYVIRETGYVDKFTV